MKIHILNKKNNGITLIALVVTIILLLILAGVSINMLTGQSGILSRAGEAKEKTENSQDLEYLQLKATETLMDYYQKNTDKSEDEYILEKLNEDTTNKIDVNTQDKTITYNGKTYAISDIIGNESEKAKIENDNMKQISLSTVENTDVESKKLLESGKVRLVIEENDTSMKAAIPNGFYYVTGKPSTGLVISDRYGDDDQNTKGGNQFVWVPCSGSQGVTYETELAKTWKEKYSSKQFYYSEIPSEYTDAGTKLTDWTDDGGDNASVAKYGGFYIARYEAGVPSNATFYANSDGATNANNKNATEYIPVSKKNNQSWNYISQKNAKTVSANMYKGSTSVTSSLVDSYAWDTTVEWMEKSINGIATNSTKYGNYVDNAGKTITGLYAIHRYTYSLSDNAWMDLTGGTTYGKGTITTIHRALEDGERSKYAFLDNSYDDTQYGYALRTEIATGTLEDTKVKNIYDMAGNMHEWTSETGKHGSSENDAEEYAVLRGGSFNSYGENHRLSVRLGNYVSGWSAVSIGFRVVLYITL